MKHYTVMSHWLDQLQAEGQNTFTVAQTESDTNRSPTAVQAALRRLKKQKRIVSLRRRFFVVVPPEYKAAGRPDTLLDSIALHQLSAGTCSE
ncbi:MAG: hypothetical protein K8S62_02270 [Candidatus Sabulitectum sp.]|nr:hypothetical protein [Candidatus Sabulitectum sp.]